MFGIESPPGAFLGGAWDIAFLISAYVIDPMACGCGYTVVSSISARSACTGGGKNDLSKRSAFSLGALTSWPFLFLSDGSPACVFCCFRAYLVFFYII